MPFSFFNKIEMGKENVAMTTCLTSSKEKTDHYFSFSSQKEEEKKQWQLPNRALPPAFITTRNAAPACEPRTRNKSPFLSLLYYLYFLVISIPRNFASPPSSFSFLPLAT
jgi:hypothetical protein